MSSYHEQSRKIRDDSGESGRSPVRPLPNTRRHANADAVPAESEPVFLPVEVEVATSPVRALATAPAGRIEIELSCGHRITAEGGFDVDVLARLLKGLAT